jgi:MoaA/NifB/PqqE/SkfB family radical SAM enzyme
MVKRYNVRYRQALEDQRILRDQILTLATNPDVDPVVYLGLDREDPYDRSPTAPYRVDLALTYRCDETGAQDILARKRVDRELTTEEWAHVIDTLWQAGVPHLTFTGGEATLRPDLIDLIKHAEANGQVTGLLSDGKALSDRGYVEQLALAGLDHLLITWDPSHPESLAGLREALVSDIFTGVHLTLSEDMLEESDDLLQQLRNAGVTAVSISARETLQEAELHLAETRQRCADLSLDLIWELPVPFTQHNPIRLEVADSQQGAGRAWLYVEPDGDVLPAQGIDRVLGNLTRDSWEQIWSSAQSQPAA